MYNTYDCLYTYQLTNLAVENQNREVIEYKYKYTKYYTMVYGVPQNFTKFIRLQGSSDLNDLINQL